MLIKNIKRRVEMERLTIEYDGLFVPKKICTTDRFGEADNCDPCDSVCDEDCKNCVIQECFTYLGEYEDTGLTPQEIMELKERDTARAPEEIRDAFGDGRLICPNCRNSVINYFNRSRSPRFCMICGQRIQWRE